jgi:hypothetical protein
VAVTPLSPAWAQTAANARARKAKRSMLVSCGNTADSMLTEYNYIK